MVVEWWSSSCRDLRCDGVGDPPNATPFFANSYLQDGPYPIPPAPVSNVSMPCSRITKKKYLGFLFFNARTEFLSYNFTDGPLNSSNKYSIPTSCQIRE